jgi:opacity protein-like surface antigen
MANALIAAIFALALPAAAHAQAQATDDYARRGFYLGGGGTYAFENFQDTGGIDFDDSIGANALVGYRLFSRFATQVSFEWVEGFELDEDAFFDLEVETFLLTFDVKAVPLTGRFQPYLVAGVGALYAETEVLGTDFDDADFAARAGAGIDLYLTRNIFLALEAAYVLPTGDVEDLDYVSTRWGLGFRF